MNSPTIWGGEDHGDDGHDAQHDGGQPHAEPECVPNPSVKPCAEIKAAHGLEALPEADDGGVADLHDPADDAHGRDRRVAEAARRHVQADGRQTGQPLPGQRGNAAPENFLGSLRVQAEAAGLDGNIARTAGHEQKHRKTDGLSNGRSDGCTRHLHIQ